MYWRDLLPQLAVSNLHRDFIDSSIRADFCQAEQLLHGRRMMALSVRCFVDQGVG